MTSEHETERTARHRTRAWGVGLWPVLVDAANDVPGPPAVAEHGEEPRDGAVPRASERR